MKIPFVVELHFDDRVGFVGLLRWLRELHRRDNDYCLKRWKHHLRKGENRIHWDFKIFPERYRDRNKHTGRLVEFHFTSLRHAQLFKLRWDREFFDDDTC